MKTTNGERLSTDHKLVGGLSFNSSDWYEKQRHQMEGLMAKKHKVDVFGWDDQLGAYSTLLTPNP